MECIKVCVVGATGYAGVEVCRLVLNHPNMELVMATDRKEAGTKLAAVYPSFAGVSDIELSLPDPERIAEVADVAFLAVPHTASLAITPRLLEAGVTVLDLSADYRLHDPKVYEAWYNTPHTSPELLSQTVYGLPELNREGLSVLAARRAAGEAVLVSVPGCYPTATALAATPALAAGLVAGDLVISDAISGVSGAGRGCNARTHFCHANESVEAYGVAKHRHTPEIEQILGKPGEVVFTPHLVPQKRGLLSTVYLQLTDEAADMSVEDMLECYHALYDGRPFVQVLPAGKLPRTASVVGTNVCQVGLAKNERTHTLVAIGAIDNLCKGAAGQGVQCANLVFGLDEKTGLSNVGMPV